MIIFDLDGTLTLTDHRQHYIVKPQGAVRTWKADWDAFFKASAQDLPNVPIVDLFRTLRHAPKKPPGWYRIGIFSGRSDVVRAETIAWLDKYDICFDFLKMRKEGDFTADNVLKRQWFNELDEDVVLAVDDRDKVVEMWRALGVTCMQVAAGDF